MLNDILQAYKFSDVTFAPRELLRQPPPVGDSTIQVTGVFTLHGAPHTITVPMQIHIDGNNLTAKTTFKVPYVQWGLKDPSWFVLKVAKEVDVNCNPHRHPNPASSPERLLLAFLENFERKLAF